MRISTNQRYDQNIRNIMENQRQLSETENSLSTLKRINKPSDDPVGASKVIRLTEELDSLEQYRRNNDLVTGSLEQQQSILDNVISSVGRARVLMLEAGSGIMADADREAIGGEIEQIRNEVLDLMNSKDANGNYIFAGHQSDSPAYNFNPGAANAVTFVGDTGTNSVQLSDSVSVKSSSSGWDIFDNVPARRDFTVDDTATVTDASVSQQDTYDNFYKTNYDAVTPANNNYQLEVLGTGQVQLSNTGTGAVVETVDYTAGEPFTIKGMSFTLDAAAGDTVDFSLDAPQKKNLAETLHDAFEALTKGGGDDLQEMLNDAIVGLDNGLEKVRLERSSLGGRLNIAESVYSTNLDMQISAESARSSIEDVDFAKASGELAKQELALNASLATFPKIANLSLFNYI
ncbi:flagellar hook-associated protein FlgL [Alteromonas pelagimontana]|uniref:Flagellar hook-associated protein FlgL n=1 Tax=Alteromonas pelagimontana TaxID=1858656 RepID=A0A6M4MF59_9ALTE|nr:flagellar hook-associated protein FlgL [Alteromonas pelagimontana]QJR81811.1 flagellar hook-associated protein FlgL [Alteromonas pelagimontana]